MIALQKYLVSSWEVARGILRLDLEAIEAALNGLENDLSARITAAGTTGGVTIGGSPTPVPRYVASTGPGGSPQWDQIDLGSGGVTGRLPLSHLTLPPSADVLLGRGNGALGDWQPITLDPTLQMTGGTLSVNAPGVVSMDPIVSSFLFLGA